MDKLKKVFVLLIISITLASCEPELSKDEKIIQQIRRDAAIADTISLKDYFTFEWDEVVVPHYRIESDGILVPQNHTDSVESIMGKHYCLKRVDESLYEGLIFFKDKQLIYEFYWAPGAEMFFGWYDYPISIDDCEFSVEILDDTYDNTYHFDHIKEKAKE